MSQNCVFDAVFTCFCEVLRPSYSLIIGNLGKSAGNEGGSQLRHASLTLQRLIVGFFFTEAPNSFAPDQFQNNVHGGFVGMSHGHNPGNGRFQQPILNWERLKVASKVRNKG